MELAGDMYGFGMLGNTIYHYIAYALVAGTAIFLLVRFQSRTLYRTRKLLQEKEKAYKEIDRQRYELERKNKDVTDSLIYASYIQKALLPSDEYFDKLLPESFIFYLPKEIVSGDFYWISKSEGKIFVAAADCTGHGVPGAFMSMIGVELLNKIIIDQKIKNPAKILAVLSEGISRTFQSNSGNTGTIKDGMDIGLCVIDKLAREIDFAGAFFPLYLIRENNLIEIKGDRLSIGVMGDTDFKNHKLPVETGDVIYMFSDGYADQFGGPENKKFMYRRFRHLLLTIHRFPMEEQQRIIRDSIATWSATCEQVDDLMVIGMSPLPV